MREPNIAENINTFPLSMGRYCARKKELCERRKKRNGAAHRRRKAAKQKAVNSARTGQANTLTSEIAMSSKPSTESPAVLSSNPSTESPAVLSSNPDMKPPALSSHRQRHRKQIFHLKTEPVEVPAPEPDHDQYLVRKRIQGPSKIRYQPLPNKQQQLACAVVHSGEVPRAQPGSSSSRATRGSRSERPLLTCEPCGKQYLGRDALLHHVTHTHASTPRFQCSLCPSLHSELRDLRLHWLHSHQGEPQFTSLECELCGKLRGSRTALEAHVRRVHGAYLACHVCGHVSLSPALLQDHCITQHGPKAWSKQVVASTQEINHKLSTLALPICFICQKPYRKLSPLRVHILFQHLKLPRFQCYHCAFAGTQYNHMKSHIQDQHPGVKDTEFTITEEMKGIYKKQKDYITVRMDHSKFVKFLAYTVKRHAEEKHPKKRFFKTEDFYQCDDIDDTMSEISMLNHFHEHHLTAMICTICMKNVMQNALVKPEKLNRLLIQWFSRHSNPHKKHSYTKQRAKKIQSPQIIPQESKSAPYYGPGMQCEFCAKLYFTKNGLRVHMVQTHLDMYHFKCLNCNFAHATKSVVYNHWLELHGSRYPKVITNDLYCEFCMEHFQTEPDLRGHVTARHGVELQCNRCRKSFVSIGQLKEHILSKHKPEAWDLHIGTLYKRARRKVYKCAKNSVTREYMCFMCNIVSYSTHDTLLRHVISGHLKIDLLECRICTHRCRDQGEMQSHCSQAHPRSTKPVQNRSESSELGGKTLLYPKEENAEFTNTEFETQVFEPVSLNPNPCVWGREPNLKYTTVKNTACVKQEQVNQGVLYFDADVSHSAAYVQSVRGFKIEPQESDTGHFQLSAAINSEPCEASFEFVECDPLLEDPEVSEDPLAMESNPQCVENVPSELKAVGDEKSIFLSVPQDSNNPATSLNIKKEIKQEVVEEECFIKEEPMEF